MAVIGGFALGLVCAALAGLVLLANRYRLTPKSLKLPFVEFDSSRFDDLSPVRMFQGLSMAAIAPSEEAIAILRSGVRTVEPVVMVHLGWQIVADRFVQRFMKYPDEANVRAAVAELGTQTVDFVTMFDRIYRAAIADPARMPMDFAHAYFLRAPSLADRVDGGRALDRAALLALVATLADTSRSPGA